MYDPQYMYDLQENNAGVGTADSQSWLSRGDHTESFPSILERTLSSVSSASAAGNVDRVLYKEMIEIVPLIHSLIQQKPKTSFTRKGSISYTKAPSRESMARKTTGGKGRSGAQSKKQKDQNKCADPEGNSDFSMFSSMSLTMEKDREELLSLKEQLEDLQRKLSEKDELLKSAEISKTESATMQAKLDEMKALAAEKDLLLKSTQQQLSDVKVNLADKQASVEKLQWEVMMSNQRVEKLQRDLEVVQGEISSFMLSFEELARNRSATTDEDYNFNDEFSDHLFEPDNQDDGEMQLLEAAKEAYLAAVTVAKEKRDEESVAAAARARFHLQSLVLSS